MTAIQHLTIVNPSLLLNDDKTQTAPTLTKKALGVLPEFSNVMQFRTPEELQKWVAKFSHALNFKDLLTGTQVVDYKKIEAVANQILTSKDSSLSTQNLLEALPPDAYYLYSPDLQKEPQLFATQVLKDCQRTPFFYIKKMTMGDNGPTLFGTFPMQESSIPVVFKCLKEEEEEFHSNCLYEAVSNRLSSPKGHFQVPRSLCLDLKNNRLLNLDQTELPLSQKQTSSIQNHLKDIFRFAKVGNVKPAKIMISEKVDGATLLDFTQGKEDELYNNLLPQQKESLFFQMGQLAFSDILLRQLDRITKPTVDGKELDAGEQSNIGNVMIVSPKTKDDLPVLYAIDNDIKLSFDKRDAKVPENLTTFFLDFLHQMKENPSDQANELTNTSIASLKQAFSRDSCYLANAFDDDQNKVTSAIENAQPFLKDLEVHREAFSLGILNVYETLTDKPIETLPPLIPALLDEMISTRFSQLKDNH